jgi:ribonuclease D
MSDAQGPSRQRRRRDRRSRRSRNHDLAHAEAAAAKPATIPDHPEIPAAPHELVGDAAGLEAICAHIRERRVFAYDTEFIGEESYLPRFCLIQLATDERVAVVDCLVDLDLTPIWRLIADPDLTTIVHAGQQDLEPVVRFLDAAPAAVFDTQVAAAFIDRPYPMSLRQLVREMVGVSLPKALTFTEWDRRPLSDVHLRYAADDVRYLPALAAALRADLEARGHLAWAEAECRALTQPERYRFDLDARTRRLLGTRSLKPKNVAVLRELVALRDAMARERDVPPRTLLMDEVLMRVAKSPASSQKALGAVKGMPWPVVDAHGQRLLEAVERGLELSQADRPRITLVEESPEQRVRVDALWNLVCAYCQARGVDPKIVTGRRDVARLLYDRRRGENELPFESGWRHELLGSLLDGLLSGEREVSFHWDGGRLETHARPHARFDTLPLE